MQSPFHQNFLVAASRSYLSALRLLEDFASCAIPPLKLPLLPLPLSRVIALHRTMWLLFSSRCFPNFPHFYFFFPPTPTTSLSTVVTRSGFAARLQAEAALLQLNSTRKDVLLGASFVGAPKNNKSSCRPTSLSGIWSRWLQHPEATISKCISGYFLNV